jgi:hypothetical protein
MTKRRLYSKNSATRYNKRNVEVDSTVVKALRTVGDKEAFYFYEDIGKPTGEAARNLTDFLDKVKTVKAESLKFHLQRNDFRNWIAKMLGDAKLAKELAKISASSSDDIRTTVCKAVEGRIKELKELSTGLTVADNTLVLLPAS